MVAQSRNEAWLGKVKEEALEPDLPICDPHHHLWDFRQRRVQERYLLDEILEDPRGGHNVVSTVFIECGAMFKADGPETTALRRRDRVRERHRRHERVGHLRQERGSPPGSSARPICASATRRPVSWMRILRPAAAGFAASGAGHSGTRAPTSRTTAPNPPEGLLLHDDFRAGFKHLGPRKLSFEVWCAHPQLPDAIASRGRSRIRRSFSTTSAGRSASVPTRASRTRCSPNGRRQIDELAPCPNVVAKLGGINMEINGFGWEHRPRRRPAKSWPKATRRYYEYTIERFGAERCMFESNFPVDKLSCSYTVLWNSFKRLSNGYSAEERAELFHDTAARVYRL